MYSVLMWILVLGIAVFPVGLLVLIISAIRHKSKKPAGIIIAISVLLIVAPIVGVMSMPVTGTPKNENGLYDVYNDVAISKAEEAFHAKIKLKNESSYTLNNADVYIDNTKVPNQRPNTVWVYVVLDISAQNSMGGMTRKNYTVKMSFQQDTGIYTCVDLHEGTV
ncbi:MAG: hypothetical protein MR567_03305 [Oscillospiraceae bacterium]|nr:hypothetical protein [Oscillospiraceae bacterium]